MYPPRRSRARPRFAKSPLQRHLRPTSSAGAPFLRVKSASGSAAQRPVQPSQHLRPGPHLPHDDDGRQKHDGFRAEFVFSDEAANELGGDVVEGKHAFRQTGLRDEPGMAGGMG